MSSATNNLLSKCCNQNCRRELSLNAFVSIQLAVNVDYDRCIR